jgi:hypothetical protein
MNPQCAESEALTANEVAAILAHVPTRPAYPEWVLIIAAVASVLRDEDAIAVLSNWSPEESEGEYRKKLRSRLRRVGIGTLIARAKRHGFDASAFARQRRTTGGILPANLPRNDKNRAAPSKRAQPVSRPTGLNQGTAADYEIVRRLRRLPSTAGMAEAANAGCLAFGQWSDLDEHGRWIPVAVFVVMDPTGRNLSARRMDDQKWRCIGGEKCRCPRETDKHWLVGIYQARPGQRLIALEGDGDFITGWHEIARAGITDAAPVGLLTACADLDQHFEELAPLIAGREIWIVEHRDPNGAGHDAAMKWAASLYRMGAREVRILAIAHLLPEGGTDLNDAIAAQPKPSAVPQPNPETQP